VDEEYQRMHIHNVFQTFSHDEVPNDTKTSVCIVKKEKERISRFEGQEANKETALVH